MMRTCKRCGTEKPLDEYPKNGKDKEGNVRHRVNCKTCYNVERKLTKQKSVTKFLNNTKNRTGEVGTYELQDWRDAMVHFGGGCAYCREVPARQHKMSYGRGGKKKRLPTLTRDHVVAVNNGGGTTRQNIVPACRSCNSSKGDTPVEEWMKDKEQLEKVIAWTQQA